MGYNDIVRCDNGIIGRFGTKKLLVLYGVVDSRVAAETSHAGCRGIQRVSNEYDIFC